MKTFTQKKNVLPIFFYIKIFSSHFLFFVFLIQCSYLNCTMFKKICIWCKKIQNIKSNYAGLPILALTNYVHKSLGVFSDGSGAGLLHRQQTAHTSWGAVAQPGSSPQLARLVVLSGELSTAQVGSDIRWAHHCQSLPVRLVVLSVELTTASQVGCVIGGAHHS